jgi:Regulator of ribonuclease activity B
VRAHQIGRNALAGSPRRARLDGGPGVTIAVLLGLVSLTAAVGFAFPGRSRVALRITAAVVVLAYVLYFGWEYLELLRGHRQPFAVGQPSTLMAGLGLLVWGIPLLLHALSGRSPRERAYATAKARDTSGALMDRETLSALERAGADLSLPTETEFLLVFPSEAHARSAENLAVREGYRVRAYGAGDGNLQVPSSSPGEPGSSD